MKTLFLHGWQSAPGGVKPSYPARHGHEVINPKLPDEDFEEALRIAQVEYDRHRPDVVVGSSRGGALAMNLDSGDTPLVLLCPAWKRWGTARTVKQNTTILHSRADDVVSFADSEELARNSGLPAWTLIEVGTDHRLADPESLETVLEACLMDDEEDVAEEEADDILERDWTGLCYTAALRWVSEAEDRDWLVVHRTVLSERAGKRIEYAWCERGDMVVDLAMPVGARVIGRDKYYRVLQPQVRKAYPCEDALLLAIRSRHDGPWDDSEQRRG
jgi:hypothetical protein